MMRYCVRDEDGELIRKFYTKEECEPYLTTGCVLTILPKPVKISEYQQALKNVGESLF